MTKIDKNNTKNEQRYKESEEKGRKFGT